MGNRESIPGALVTGNFTILATVGAAGVSGCHKGDVRGGATLLAKLTERLRYSRELNGRACGSSRTKHGKRLVCAPVLRPVRYGMESDRRAGCLRSFCSSHFAQSVRNFRVDVAAFQRVSGIKEAETIPVSRDPAPKRCPRDHRRSRLYRRASSARRSRENVSDRWWTPCAQHFNRRARTSRKGHCAGDRFAGGESRLRCDLRAVSDARRGNKLSYDLDSLAASGDLCFLRRKFCG